MQPEVHSTYMVWPKIGQKYPKYDKSGQKLPKKGDFVQQNSAKRTGLLHIFFESIYLACLRRAIWTPKVLSETLFSWKYVWHNIAPFYNISHNSIFFTDQDMIEVIAKNCAKTKRPTKKIDKSNFEVHWLRIILHLLTLI